MKSKSKSKADAKKLNPKTDSAKDAEAKTKTAKNKATQTKMTAAKKKADKKTAAKNTAAKKATAKKKTVKKPTAAAPLPSLNTADRKALTALQSGIYHCDCVTGMQQLPEGSVDLIFADPPFNIGYKYDVYDDQLAADEYLKWSEEWIREAHRILKSDGSFWLAIGDDFAAELKLVAQQVGFHCRSWVIWYYTFGVNCKFKFTRSHTHLLYFVKDVKNFTFNSEDLDNRIPSARMLVYNDARTNPKGRLPDDTWIIPPDVPATFALRPQDMQDCFLPNESDWYFPRVAGTFKERAGFHGCQMPEQLLGRIIRTCSNEADVVLDPFSGSASTLLVAKKLQRKQIGFELSNEYSTAGTERLDAVKEGDDLVGAAEPKMSALPTWKKAQQANGNKTARPSKSVPKATVHQERAVPEEQTVPEKEAVPEQQIVSMDADAVLSLIDALGRTLPKDATLSSEVQVVVQRAVLSAFAGIADRYSLADLNKGGRALKAFHKQCVALSVPGDADSHLQTLKTALQSHSQLF